MTWLVDAGNTRLKLARVRADGLIGKPRVLAYDQLTDALSPWADADAEAEAVVVACVAANAHREQLQSWLPARARWAQTPREGLGIRCSYANPLKWGVERWLALAAVHHQRGASAYTGSAVLDIGTATTLDICDADGTHLGGWIAPGPAALIEALGKGRTALPQASSEMPSQLGLAQDTEEGLLLGALHCAVGSIRAAQEAARENGVDRLTLTGGGAALLRPYLATAGIVMVDELVLRGLALWALEENHRNTMQ